MEYIKINKKNLIIIILIIIIAIISVLNLRKTHRNILPEMIFNDDSDRQSLESDSAKIDYIGGFTVKEKLYPVNLKFINNKTNKCNFVVSIYLSDGTKIYQSDLLKPSESEAVIKLDYGLDKGIYNNAILCYECFDDNDNPLTRCEFTAKITSI